MNEFLETLKVRMVDSQKRLAEATARFQKAQQELGLIQQEAVSWQNAFNAETKKEQMAAAEAAITAGNASPVPAIDPKPMPAAAPELNKTERIREVLQRHPAGMTPAEVWHEIKTEVPDRTYVYSVLKRLKDREQVTVRRKKYIFRITPKPEEAKQQITVQ